MDKAELLTLMERAESRCAGLLEDIPEDKLCYQPFPGANHALWTVGHLAVVLQRVTAFLEGRQPEPPPRYKELFDLGSVPSPDRSDYPPAAEVLRFAAAMRADWLKALREVDPSRLQEPTPERWRQFAANWGMMAAAMGQHTFFHLGELAVIRKALGLKPKYA